MPDTGARATFGLGLAVLSALSFGLSGPFAKALIDAGWSASGAVLVRLGGAAAVLLLVLAAVRPGVVAAIRSDGPALLLYGVLAMAGVQVAFFNAVRYLPVSVALLLEYLGPIVVIAWVWLVRRQPPSGRTLLGGVVATIGLPLVVEIWTGVGLRWEGVAWGLLAAIARIGASRGSLVALLEVVASATASWLLLGEVPSGLQAAGGVLILGGVVLTRPARPAAVASA